ncbi:MAG: hypothetical protein CL561_07675 [Alphaproteobacteria bacterium]|nr:hypothetical protein [Alphaproteobacteria bacterium]|tara:strand:+ start:748 stop:1545 length:798 start_codon:yes stop_codon:yes gene_type:complete
MAQFTAKSILTSFMVMGVMTISFQAQHANAQYLWNFNKKDDAKKEQQAEPRAPIYNPQIQKQYNTNQQRSVPQASAPSDAIKNYDIGSALMNDFIKKSSQGAAPDGMDPNAPRLQDLPSIAAIPDNPDQYCADYEKNNPEKQDSQTQMEQLLRERIKPVNEIRPFIIKPCLGKVRDVAEKMLVDYTSYKRNELIMRAQQGQGNAMSTMRKVRELPMANLNYTSYANSECMLSRQDAASNPHELNDMVQSCVIKMLKKRIQQIASM